MIGFGEIRRLAAQWQLDITEVEQIYASDWLLDGIFRQPELLTRCILRGAAALRHAHLPDYPPTETIELAARDPLDPALLRDALADAARIAAAASQMRFELADLERGGAKFEYTGPLGRRSAAQPRIMLAIVFAPTRLPPARVASIQRFSDTRATKVAAIALEEFAGERMATLAQTPRVRDVFDLWFALTRGGEKINSAAMRAVAQEIAGEKKIALPRAEAIFAPEHRAILERGWERALKNVHAHPPFEQMESDLQRALRSVILNERSE